MSTIWRLPRTWCKTWFSDVYRRPSIKTVYEPMPGDRPRCSICVTSPRSSQTFASQSILKRQAPSFGQQQRVSRSGISEGFDAYILLFLSPLFPGNRCCPIDAEALYHTLLLEMKDCIFGFSKNRVSGRLCPFWDETLGGKSILLMKTMWGSQKIHFYHISIFEGGPSAC